MVGARTYTSDRIHAMHVRVYVHVRVDVIAEKATQKRKR